MLYQVFLSNTNNLQADLIDEIQTVTTTPGQSGSGSIVLILYIFCADFSFF